VKPPGPKALTIAGVAILWLALAAARQQQPDLEHMGFDRGSTQAPIKVVEFGDFGCSACAQFALEVFPGVDSEFVQTGRVHWKFVPFVLGAFRNSTAATAAALCAAEQGAFWSLHDRLYRDQRTWSAARDPRPALAALARETGIAPAPFERCLQDGATAERIRQHNRLTKRMSINATPTFFVGNRRIWGALPADLFRRMLLQAAQP
jgi:protein-disulfide isomerase